jgi:hypothetical protein
MGMNNYSKWREVRVNVPVMFIETFKAVAEKRKMTLGELVLALAIRGWKALEEEANAMRGVPLAPGGGGTDQEDATSTVGGEQGAARGEATAGGDGPREE